MEQLTIKYRYIFSQRLAGYLMQKGFILLRLNKNLDDPTKNVFLFKDSKEIESAIQEYQKLYS
jgi:hypothetical protein